MKHVTFSRLPLENLRHKPLRTAALMVVSICLSAVFFGGSLLAVNLANGLQSMQARLGADIMVIPQDTRSRAEALLTNGESSTFYFTNNIEDLVKAAPGVQTATVQTYITSLSAGCCAAKLQIIGFDPSTDFVIGPWIASQHPQALQKGEMIAGSNVIVSYKNTVRLYGKEWRVVAQLAKTGTGVDNAVFVDRHTIPDVVEASSKVGHTAIPKEYMHRAISTVMVKVRKGYTPEGVAEAIRKTTKLPNIGIVFPGGITRATRASLQILTRSIGIIIAVFWIVGVLILVAVFASSVNERKKEFASLRLMGMTRQMLMRIVFNESLIIGGVGGMLGVGFASLILFPYNTLIAQQLQLPYLEITALPVMLLMIASIAFSLLTLVVTSVVMTLRITLREPYLSLREGE